jgi:FkbM family methyltransferase
MSESLAQWATLLFKLFVDRRRFRGRSEFYYRIMRGVSGRYRVKIVAKDSAFQTIVSLRRETSDLATFEHIFANNDYNLRRLARWDEIFYLYSWLADEGLPLILDLGANIGLAALYFAKNWPKAHLIAVEPEEQNYRVMCDNLSGIKNVQLLHAAVASVDGAVKIVNPDAEAWEFRTEVATPETAETIDALSVQSLLRMAPPGSLPFIVKIDIEGFESNLFSENTDWVALFPIIIIELHDRILPRQGAATNFLRVIAQQNRDFLFIAENVISIENTPQSALPIGEGARDAIVQNVFSGDDRSLVQPHRLLFSR